MFVALLTCGCDTLQDLRPARIADIHRDPRRFADQPVTISGKVIAGVSILSRGIFEVADGTARIAVYSAKPMPENGSQVKIRGCVGDLMN